MTSAFDISISSKRFLPRQGLVRVNFIGASFNDDCADHRYFQHQGERK